MFFFKCGQLTVLWYGLWCTMALGKKHERVVANKHIAYGGILSNYLPDIPANDTDIEEAAKFAVTYGNQRFPAAFSKADGQIEAYSIGKANKLKLTFTMDGLTPWRTEVVDPSTGDIVTMPLIWGVTVAFRISWPNIPASYTHQFIVTEYFDAGYFVYQHTFYKSIGRVAQDPMPSANIQQPKPNVAVVSEASSTDIRIDLTEDIVENKNLENVMDKASQEDIVNRGHCDKDGHCEDITNPAEKYKYNEGETGHCTDSESQECSKSNSGDMVLRLLSYNTWNFNTKREDTASGKYYWRRIRQLAKLVLKSQAPIVCFQEVRFDGSRRDARGPSQVQHLADTLKDYQFVFRPAQIQTHGLPERIEEGLAIFSKFPILAAKHVLLLRDPHDPSDGHQRMLLHAEILLPNQAKVHVLNTHLSLSHVARQRTVRQIWKYVEKLQGPTFLMGDFNAEAHNDEVRFLAGKVALNGVRTHGFVDIWQTLHPDEDGYTFSTLDEDFTKRIDLIFMKEDDHVKLLNATLLDDYKRSYEASSDHLGLLGTFHMKSPNTGS